MRNIRRFIAAVMCIAMVFVITGCNNREENKQPVTSDTPSKEIVVIKAGDAKVYLDEAKYYAYTAQATYETYYISEGKEIDWESRMKDEASWQQGVKSIVFDNICRRECMYALAEEYNVSLTESEEEDIKADVANYYAHTNKKLASKIGIEKARLKYVFEKQRIAQKLENILNTTDKKNADKTYEMWKEGNTVTAEEQWIKITYSEHIFTLEDIQ